MKSGCNVAFKKIYNIHVHTPLSNLIHMTECLCPLYCLVQSPNSVTQHLAELSADPVYISRLTTTMQMTALEWPSIVCNICKVTRGGLAQLGHIRKFIQYIIHNDLFFNLWYVCIQKKNPILLVYTYLSIYLVGLFEVGRHFNKIIIIGVFFLNWSLQKMLWYK